VHGQLRVRGDGLVSAAGHLEGRARLARSHLAGCARVTAGLRDPTLQEGVRVLADVVADALELVSQDLELLSSKVRAGAAVYERVESALASRR
jgi:hypothetical protein